MGPIETKLRARLNFGAGLSRVEVHRFGGAMARGIVDRLVREGSAVERDGRYTLATYEPDPAEMERLEAERLARFEARRREETAYREREAEIAQRRVESARRAEEQRMICDRRGYADDEWQLVLAERIAAVREGRG